MYYTLYKTTNILNGKFYIGCHKTNDLHDDYIGSGKYLTNSINKYGIENFIKEIMQLFFSSEQMYEMESLLVDEKFVERKDTYNLKVGGEGGFDYINENGLKCKTPFMSDAFINAREKVILKRKTDLEYAKQHYKKTREGLKKYYKTNYNAFKNQQHTEETKKKIGLNTSFHQKGKKNSQYGTMWITDGINNKKIKKVSMIPEGWNKGRKLK
jgi:hypothetical protein